MRGRGFGLPLVLIAVGVVALLANFGVLPFSPLAMLALWPVLLVIAGIDLLLSRRAPVAALALDAAVVVGALALLVSQPNLPTIVPFVNIGSRDCPAGAAQGALSIPRDGAQKLSLHLTGGATTYRVLAPAGALVEARSDLEQLHSRVSRSGDAIDVNITQCWNGPIMTGRDVEVRIAGDVPTALDLTGGAGSFELDLREVRLTELRLTNGASSTKIQLPRPSGDVSVRITGGASSTDIDLGGAAARVETTGGLTSLNSPSTVTTGVGRSVYETPGYASAADRYTITVTGGVSSVTVR